MSISSISTEPTQAYSTLLLLEEACSCLTSPKPIINDPPSRLIVLFPIPIHASPGAPQFHPLHCSPKPQRRPPTNQTQPPKRRNRPQEPKPRRIHHQQIQRPRKHRHARHQQIRRQLIDPLARRSIAGPRDRSRARGEQHRAVDQLQHHPEHRQIKGSHANDKVWGG